MKILLSWSSGKDSAWALHVLNQQHPGAVAALLTTSTRRWTAWRCTPSGATCSRRRRARPACRCASCRFRIRARTRSTRSGCGAAVAAAVARRLHARRVRRSVPRGRPPLSRRAARRHRARRRCFRSGASRRARSPSEMIAGGLRARLACVDTRVLDASFAGREFDRDAARATCRRASTRAARTASSTPASTPARCSASRSPSSPAKSSRASRSPGAICTRATAIGVDSDRRRDA